MGAVFLSYASQDIEAAKRICAALRAAGVEVFLDQSELRGGDAWDGKIRHEIHECALFIPIVSQHTQHRLEGYFRHEWNLAIERAHHMAQQKPFLVPVVVDGTSDQEAVVPDAFRAVQWTHLPGGDMSRTFLEQIQRLLSPELLPLSAESGARSAIQEPARAPWRWKPAVVIALAVVVFATPAYFIADKLWSPKHSAPSTATFAPPPRSIAVLPFVNMSGDKEREYFSDGLTEELLNSVSEISELQVAARTSAFSFKGKDIDIGTIARKLNVGAVLEGSVRRSGNRVRITAQLDNAVTGFHLWSHTYDRDLSDVLKLETEIANAVASALKVRLLGDEAAKIELGGTHNPAAFDAYLRGSKALHTFHEGKDLQLAIAAYTEAIRLDPNYALAYANRSIVLSDYALMTSGRVVREAQSDALKAIALAPDLAEGHLALARYFATDLLDFTRAYEEFERALALAPGNAHVLQDYGPFTVFMGRTEPGIAAARRAVMLDALGRDSHFNLGYALYLGRQNREALAALQDTLLLDPEYPQAYVVRGLAYYALGDLQGARASCERTPNDSLSQWCLAITYNKLGRHADAEAVLAKLKAAQGDGDALQYAEIYAQWGNVPKALKSLQTALRLRDPGLLEMKVSPLLDPLRTEPPFRAVMQELKFPN